MNHNATTQSHKAMQNHDTALDHDFLFLLGGQDLEMRTIEQLLLTHGQHYVNQQLRWGATVADYATAIAQAQRQGQRLVFVELAHADARQGIVVDHHGPAAGKHQPSALRQVFDLLALPEQDWTRHFQLVAANDIGHTAAMQAMGATQDEMQHIRQLDRQAQGITEAEEAAAEQALQHLSQLGAVTVATIPHNRAATITDRLDTRLGGPGYAVLWVRSPQEENVYGPGELILHLANTYPDGWWGGALPDYGFWGYPGKLDQLAQHLNRANR